MKLFLASEAKNPFSIKKLEEYVGGFKGKRMLYIPTAANATGWGSWREGGSWNLVQTLGLSLTLLQLEDYWQSDHKDLFKEKDIVWFAGGQCGYLMYWVRRTRVDIYLREMVDKGTIYVGSSAGSMITAQTLDIVEWYIGEQERGASAIPGLGLVDFDIYPHYEDHLYEEIKKQYKGNKLFLLKNGEEVIVENNTVKVIGEERIIIRGTV